MDTNVFNSVERPKQDFTATAGPQVDWWLRAGRLRVHGTNGADYVYFSKYESERGVNQSHRMSVELPLNRLRPYVGGSYLDTKDRPGYEIDARARHTEAEQRAGAVVSLTAKTRIDVLGFQRRYRFTGDEEHEGSALAAALNRRSTGAKATLLFSATPLTTFTLSAEIWQERFARAVERDHESVRVMSGVELDPHALLTGSARVGYRRVAMRSPATPDFDGLVAEVDISYVLLGRTRLGMSR